MMQELTTSRGGAEARTKRLKPARIVSFFFPCFSFPALGGGITVLSMRHVGHGARVKERLVCGGVVVCEKK